MNSQLRMRIKTKRQEKSAAKTEKKTQCTREEEVLQWQNKPDWLGRWSFQRLVEWEWQEVLRPSGWTFIRETIRVVLCNLYMGREKTLLRFDEISKQMYSWNLSLRQHTIWITHFWQVKVFLFYKSTVYLCTYRKYQCVPTINNWKKSKHVVSVSYTHLTLPTILRV